MIRKTVYLTEVQHWALEVLAKAAGRTMSALVREAIDSYVVPLVDQQRKAALEGVRGMWKDRTDLPDFRALRAEWDKRLRRVWRTRRGAKRRLPARPKQ